ncbi:MAG: Ig-like domain repeat protein, partial [Actinobacteria bacterium]|nr:Ig-like domain repeat protein [Actinomycetota bacterium]
MSRAPARPISTAGNQLRTDVIASVAFAQMLPGGVLQPGRNFGFNQVAVIKATLPFSTQASHMGKTITDTATLGPAPGGAPVPTGTVTFNLYSDAACMTLVTTSTGTLNAAGTASSMPFTAAVPGTYRFTASYSGDANYAATPASACGAANEQVMLPAPVIAVTKAAAPPTQPAPTGTFTFTVQVSNPSPDDPITITTLTDNIYGDLATRPGSTCGALIGVTLAPGASSAPCSFTGTFTGVAGGTQTDIVRVNGVDVNGFTATNTANATVGLTAAPVPVIAVTKAVTPASLPAPGGSFTFTVQVSNPSSNDP